MFVMNRDPHYEEIAVAEYYNTAEYSPYKNIKCEKVKAVNNSARYDIFAQIDRYNGCTLLHVPCLKNC